MKGIAMGYFRRPHFDQPTAESAERSRRAILWLMPALMLQQASRLLEEDASAGSGIVHVALWVVATITILWILAGWPLRWLSERDRLILNDEGQRAMRADAMRWGLVAAVLTGCALMIAEIWVPIGSRTAINLLVSGGIVTAAFRFAWLNREELGEDD